MLQTIYVLNTEKWAKKTAVYDQEWFQIKGEL